MEIIIISKDQLEKIADEVTAWKTTPEETFEILGFGEGCWEELVRLGGQRAINQIKIMLARNDNPKETQNMLSSFVTMWLLGLATGVVIGRDNASELNGE